MLLTKPFIASIPQTWHNVSALLCQSRARHPPLDIDRVNFPRQSVPCQIKGDWKTDFGLNPTSFTINYLPSLLIGGLASQGDDPQIFRARGGGGPKIPQLLPAFLPSLSLSLLSSLAPTTEKMGPQSPNRTNRPLCSTARRHTDRSTDRPTHLFQL